MSVKIKKVVFAIIWSILFFLQISIAQAEPEAIKGYREFSVTLLLAKPSANEGKLSDELLNLVKPIYVGNKESCQNMVLTPSKLNVRRFDTGKNDNIIKLPHDEVEKSYYSSTGNSIAHSLGQNIDSEGFLSEAETMLKKVDKSVLSDTADSTISVETEWKNFLNELGQNNKKLFIAPDIKDPALPNTITSVKASSTDDYKQKLTELLCQFSNSSNMEIYVLADAITVKSSEPSSKTDNNTSSISVQPTQPTPSTNQDLFAIIEIGGSGIKPAILQMIYSREDDQYLVKEKSGIAGKKIEDKKYDVIALDADNRGAFHPDSIPRIAEDLKEYISKFQVDYAVPKEHIYIVGSSGVAEATHREELQQAVQNATGITMDFVTAEQEGRLVFEGTIKQIPKEKGQQDRREKQAVVIDIGSSNTKGGYFDSSTGRVDTFEIKYGTKTFSQKVDAERGNNMPFADKAKELRENVLRPAIRSEAIRVSGLKNQKRVYLIGGISWATSTLLSLDAPKYASRSTTGDQEIYTVMIFTGLTDVNRLYNRVINPNAVEQVCNDNDDVKSITDPEKKQKRLKEISNICNGIFNMDQLTGGLEILNAFALELNFNQKNVFFIQNVLNAWSVGYLKEKIERETAH
jgi:hypothetical protein